MTSLILITTLSLAILPNVQGSESLKVRAETLISKLELSPQAQFDVSEMVGYPSSKWLGPIFYVASTDYGFSLPLNSVVPYSFDNLRYERSLRDSTYDWGRPKLSEDVLTAKLRHLPSKVGIPFSYDHLTVIFKPDDRVSGGIGSVPAHAILGGNLRFEGARVGGSHFSVTIDQRSGEIVGMHCLTDFKLVGTSTKISVEDARRRNGLVWNNPGPAPEPEIVWFVPNGEWGAPDWQSQLPQRMRKSYLFHADGANLFIDIEDGKLLGGDTRTYRSQGADRVSKPPLYTWTRKPKS
jgi:hypothetical protein